MPVICFEGASAVGKTTTANTLKTGYDAFVVPEVNHLFARPENETAAWYLERQVDRRAIAGKQSGLHSLVILDGDPFQPLWYNWAYDFAGLQDLDFMERFYKPKIRNKTIEFPDLYVIFSTNEAELRKHRTGDAGRTRRNFESHLRMIEPLHRYFKAMQAFSPNRVSFLDAESMETNAEFVREKAGGLAGRAGDEPVELFDKIIKWLRENKA